MTMLPDLLVYSAGVVDPKGGSFTFTFLAELYSELMSVESNYDPFAASRAGAFWFWQQTSKNALKYGLTKRNGMDERVDFLKATSAAIRYIKDLETIFKGDSVKVLFA